MGDADTSSLRPRFTGDLPPFSTVAREAGKLSSNFFLRTFQSTHAELYSRLWSYRRADTSAGSGPVILLLEDAISSRLAISPTLIEAHVLFPARLHGHYTSLTGHGVKWLSNGCIKGVLGFGAEFDARVVASDELADEQGHSITMLLVDRPLPEVWQQQGRRVEGPCASDTCDTRQWLALDDELIMIQKTLTRWRDSFKKFDLDSGELLLRLERSLILAPGYEKSVAQKYYTVVKSVLLPTLAQAAFVARHPRSLIGTTATTGSPPARTKIAPLKGAAGNSCLWESIAAALPPVEWDPSTLVPTAENRSLVSSILERYIYLRFQQQLWTFLVTSTQAVDDAVQANIRSMLEKGHALSIEGALGLPYSHFVGEQEFLTSPTGRRRDTKGFDESAASKEGVAHSKAGSSQMLSDEKDRRVALGCLLAKWGIMGAETLLEELSTPHCTADISCVQLLKAMCAAPLPPQKLRILACLHYRLRIAVAASLAHYEPRACASNFPFDSGVDAMVLAMTLVINLACCENLTAHCRLCEMYMSVSRNEGEEKPISDTMIPEALHLLQRALSSLKTVSLSR